MNALTQHAPTVRTTCPYCGVGCGVLAQPDGRGGAAVIIAVDATTFRPLAAYEKNADEAMSRVKAIPPAKGFSEVLLPGDPEQRSKAERLRDGIPVAEATWNAIVETGKGLGLSLE